MIWGDVEMGKCRNGLKLIGELHSWGTAKMGKYKLGRCLDGELHE